MSLPKLSLSLIFMLALSGSSPFILCMGLSLREEKKKKRLNHLDTEVAI